MKIPLTNHPKAVKYTGSTTAIAHAKYLTVGKTYPVVFSSSRGPHGWIKIYNDKGLLDQYSARDFEEEK